MSIRCTYPDWLEKAYAEFKERQKVLQRRIRPPKSKPFVRKTNLTTIWSLMSESQDGKKS